MLKKHFLLSILKTLVMHNIFVKTAIIFLLRLFELKVEQNSIYYIVKGFTVSLFAK